MGNNNGIKIKRGSSSLSEFVRKPLASDEEVKAFDEYAENEAKEEEIKDSLAKIYQDEDGNEVDVRKITIKPKRGLLFNLFVSTVIIFALGVAAYGSYNYIYSKIYDSRTSVAIAIDSNKEVAAGEEFYYNLNYTNEDRVGIKDIEIKATYPDGFIFLDSDPKPDRNNDTWKIAALDSHRSGSIRVKGKLAAPADSGNIILADMVYTPENFSSEFKKSASFETKVNDIGIDFSFENSSSALVGEENEITVKFTAKPENFIGTFRLTAEHPEEVEIIKSADAAPASATSTSAAGLSVQSSGQDSWLVGNFGKNENSFKIKFKVKEKKSPNFDIKLKFELPQEAADKTTKYYLFYEKNLTYEVIKSDLNLDVIINGSPSDQGVDFGQTLNYSINYANKGETSMKDVIIMAVLESDFLDWQTLSDASNGKLSGNTISWSKQEIPALAELNSGGGGVIDFSVKLKSQKEIDLSKTYQVKSYARYSIGGKTSSAESQSNTIINKINSDLNLSEQVRYFNDDNIAVGSGPLPPKVGQITSLKVYWSINNNLHELNNLTVSVSLPAGVSWSGKNRASTGAIDYDARTNRVVWNIGRLPVTTYKADAEFSINVSPSEADRNKIMIILPGTAVNALDSATNMQINKTLKAKTTKLEDDNMAGGDGIVQ